MRALFGEILAHDSLQSKPPVFVDIGASGGLAPQWSAVAPYAICIAFDADTRDFVVSESQDSGWRKLVTLNRVVVAEPYGEVDFFLTRSPHCSSSLHPDNRALDGWAFRDLFEVERVVKLPALDLISALSSAGIDYVDWYKTDSQGTDLRIFRSLPPQTIEKILVAEFEPGIIDAYLGEDKLHHLLAFMDDLPFWVSDMQIKGSQRIDKADMASLNRLQRLSVPSFLKMAPGWCEISYLNSFDHNALGLREYLLGWLFSTIKAEHGFALRVATVGQARFADPLFKDMRIMSRRLLSKGYVRLFRAGVKKLGRVLLGRDR